MSNNPGRAEGLPLNLQKAAGSNIQHPGGCEAVRIPIPTQEKE